VHLAIKNIVTFNKMLSKFLDEEGQTKIKDTLTTITFPIKFYCLIITALLLLNAYYLYLISEKLGN
tara:strand:+ start:1020 stop:1217 length:198 start_codon:yes stop_codon:yes gene_type:complete